MIRARSCGKLFGREGAGNCWIFSAVWLWLHGVAPRLGQYVRESMMEGEGCVGCGEKGGGVGEGRRGPVWTPVAFFVSNLDFCSGHAPVLRVLHVQPCNFCWDLAKGLSEFVIRHAMPFCLGVSIHILDVITARSSGWGMSWCRS